MHSVAILRDLSSKPKLNIFSSEAPKFEKLDGTEEDTHYRYHDSLDVSRIVSFDKKLMLIARNNMGSLCTTKYVYSENKIKKESENKPILPSLPIHRIYRFQGSYDVMDLFKDRPC